MNTYEYFQNNNSESDLNSAYNSDSLNDSLHNVPFCNENNSNAGPLPTTSAVQEPIEKSTMSNLWDFLGLTNLSNKKKECLFDCSIHGARCLERCKFKDPEKCKYRCLKHGLYCSKKCIMPEQVQEESNNKCINHQTTHSGNNVQTTHSGNNVRTTHSGHHNHTHANNNSTHANNNNNSTNANNNSKIYPPLPIGNQADYMGYAPFDSNLWPSHTQSGWDMEKLNKPDPSLFIEVLVPNKFVYPEETDKPSLLF